MHALLLEEFDNDDDDNKQPTTVYTLFTEYGATEKKCLEGIYIPCGPWTLVQNNKMKSTDRKYLITLVLDMWDNFNNDNHSPISYVVWDKKHSKVKAEEEKDRKNKKKKNITQRSKRKAGETFKNIRKIFEEIEEENVKKIVERKEKLILFQWKKEKCMARRKQKQEWYKM